MGRGITAVQETFGKLFKAGGQLERDGSQFDRLLDDGDMFAIGSMQAAVLHVPGHTPADLAYVIGSTVFPGDTIFMHEDRKTVGEGKSVYGRVDIGGRRIIKKKKEQKIRDLLDYTN